MDADDRVLLIDLENTAGVPLRGVPSGGVPSRSSLVFRARVAALLGAAGRLHHCVAAFGLAGTTDRTSLSVLSEVGVAPLPVKPGRDAAEHALLAHARYVYGRGGRTFVVASADHRFSVLATLGRLEVIAWKRQEVSKRLEEAAAVVRRIHRPTAADVRRRAC